MEFSHLYGILLSFGEENKANIKRSKICCAIFFGQEIVTSFNVKIIGLIVVPKDE
jgi:hypothetical protein